MATRKTAQTVITPGDEAWQMPVTSNGIVVSVDEEMPEETATDRVARMLSDVGDDERAKVSLWRVQDKTSKLSWCQDYSVPEFEQGGMSMIREAWGPGTYDIRLHGTITGKAGKPGYGLRALQRVVIEAGQMRAGTAAPQQASGELAEFMRAMLESQRQMMAVLAERPDPMSQLTQTIALMGSMREAFGMGSAPEKTPIREIVEAIQELRGAAELVAPEKADPDNLLAMLPNVLDLIKTGMAQRAPQADAPIDSSMFPAIEAPLEPAVNPVLIQAPQPQPQSVIQNQEEQRMIAEGKAALAMLTLMAAKHTPIEDGVAFLCDYLPDEFELLIESDEWWAVLAQFAPEVAPHQAWITAVRDAYIKLPVGESTEITGDAASQVIAQAKQA